MPFTTGTARTPSELLNAINTHLVANGWTKLRGETDMNCASPKAARYWRILSWDVGTSTVDFHGLQLFNLRTTAAGANQATVGANFSTSSAGTGTASLMAAGGLLRSADIDDGAWWVKYDFGAPTTIREFYVRGDSTLANSPKNFAFQWSNDNITWTTLVEYSGITWTASEFKTFTVADGYLAPRHVASTAPRRGGRNEQFSLDFDWSTNDARDFSEDYWLWQAPGYDAARRVYVHARGQSRPTDSSAVIEFDFSIGHDAGILAWNAQAGTTAVSRSHLMDAGTVAYWLYSNSKRFVLITRSGAQDYTSTYAGFMSAFGTPDDYPFPLAISTTMPNSTTFNSGVVNASLSSCADPGLSCCIARLWDGTLRNVGNRPNNAQSNLYLEQPAESWMWPYHVGRLTLSSVWPAMWGSDYQDYNPGHAFDFFTATQQNELPLIPCSVMDAVYGNVGVLDGIFAIPSGGLLTAASVITIGGQDYRVFPNRTRREPVAWFCVRED